MISCARIMVSTAWRKASTSNWPSGPTNFIRFSDERLQAESSRNMYSEQGLEALVRGLGDLAHQVAGLVTFDGLAAHHGFGPPFAIPFGGFHEIVRDPHGVVGVLEKNRTIGFAI